MNIAAERSAAKNRIRVVQLVMKIVTYGVDGRLFHVRKRRKIMTEKERARVILCLATITAEVTTRLHYLAQKYGLDRDELVEIFAEGLTGTTKQVAGRKVEQKEPATSISKEAGHNVCAKGIIPNP